MFTILACIVTALVTYTLRPLIDSGLKKLFDKND